MKDYLKHDPWKIIEDTFHPEYSRVSESVFSLGNGFMGQRGCFEEHYSGDSHRGLYLAGVYFPDPTVVGWWKNGYPDYYGKIIHGLDWSTLDVLVNDERLDLAACKLHSFQRTLNMREGTLEREVWLTLPNRVELKIRTLRAVSMAQREAGFVRFSVTPVNMDCEIEFLSVLSGEDKNINSEREFLHKFQGLVTGDEAYLSADSRKLDFKLYAGISYRLEPGSPDGFEEPFQTSRKVGHRIKLACPQGREIVLDKYAISLSSRTHGREGLHQSTSKLLKEIRTKGFHRLLAEHKQAWEQRWAMTDIAIEGDLASQQGMRFALFQLFQSFRGDDPALNISPKGFTGEVYGGGTYWDTEAFCMPYVLGTFNPEVARGLLLYRYNHLQKAKENAEKLGFSGGAALFPMVTFNGEECHNEWEITFEEIHRNSAIVFAIQQYVHYSGDQEFLWDFGLEMMIAISRFWSQRVHFSESKRKFVILGVTGSNEYENNVHNNWYTNRMAAWALQLTSSLLKQARISVPEKFKKLVDSTGLDPDEIDKFSEISQGMFEPRDEQIGIFLQQDGYLDKEQKTVEDLSDNDRPLGQNWSWDRILRSCFIKQADVLQGIFLLENTFSLEEIRRNFEFYEPRTVHESSLSPCIHAILAAKLDKKEKALEMFQRSVRMDLNDINNDTEHGCHITSMAGAWMALVMGFAGLRIDPCGLRLDPKLPETWKKLAFKLQYQKAVLGIQIQKDQIELEWTGQDPLHLGVRADIVEIHCGKSVTLPLHGK